MVVTACILCLFVGLHYSIHLHFGMWCVSILDKQLGVALVNLFFLVLLLTFLVFLAIACTFENHGVSVNCSRSSDVFTFERVVVKLVKLTLSWGRLRLQYTRILVSVINDGHRMTFTS